MVTLEKIDVLEVGDTAKVEFEVNGEPLVAEFSINSIVELEEEYGAIKVISIKDINDEDFDLTLTDTQLNMLQDDIYSFYARKQYFQSYDDY